MAGRSLRVLIVDDEMLIRWAVSEGLAESGHAVLQAETGREALELIDAFPNTVDAVVLDYHLPDSQNLQLLSTIRQRLPAAVLVLITGFIGANAKAEALAQGAHAVVIKPFNVGALERMLIRAVTARPDHPPPPPDPT